MALVISRLSLAWKDKKSGAMQSVRFDAVTSQTYEAVQTITSHPVEEGADVVDHSRSEPRRLTVEGFMSYKPLWSNPNAEKGGEFQSLPLKLPSKPTSGSDFTTADKLALFLPTPGKLTQGVSNLVDGLLNPKPTKYTAFKFSAGDAAAKRVDDLLDALEQARKNASRIRAVTGVHEIPNMLIERIAVPRTPEDGGLIIQVDLLEVRIVTSQTVAAPDPAEARGAPLTSKGSKNAAEDKKKDKKLTSLAASTYDSAGGLLGFF